MKFSSAAGVIVAGLALTIGGTAVAAPVAAGMQANQGGEVPTQVAGPKAAKSQNGDTLGVKLRIVNNTGHSANDFNVLDGGDGAWHNVGPGDHYDVSGKSHWWGQKDVTATVRPGPAQFTMWGYNPDIGYPSVSVGDSWERYSVGESHTSVVYKYKVKVTREADEDFKLFTVDVSRN